jgi:hypothetical protein
MKTDRLIEIIGATIGLFGLAGASMNCASPDAGPATCEEAKSAYGVSVDGPQILYVGGDKSMPWSAYCVGMTTQQAVEYLELDTHDGSANFSEFSESSNSTAFTVRTQFRKVRIDPVNLTIDSTDRKFAERTTNPPHIVASSAVLLRTIDYMPYGAAETCGAFNDMHAKANVDLSNGPFEVATAACKTIGENTVTHDDPPTQTFDFSSANAGTGAAGPPTCGRASLNCLPDPAVNGEVGGQGKIQLHYTGYGTASPRP